MDDFPIKTSVDFWDFPWMIYDDLPFKNGGFSIAMLTRSGNPFREWPNPSPMPHLFLIKKSQKTLKLKHQQAPPATTINNYSNSISS